MQLQCERNPANATRNRKINNYKVCCYVQYSSYTYVAMYMFNILVNNITVEKLVYIIFDKISDVRCKRLTMYVTTVQYQILEGSFQTIANIIIAGWLYKYV